MSDIHFTTKMTDVKPTGYYVYFHRRATNGKVFYVGKGKRYRGWSIVGRNQHWNQVAKKNGVVVEVVADGLSECCAFTLEKISIYIIGLDNLCNYTNGGDGLSGFSHSEETKLKIGSAQIGEKNHMWGATVSPETRLKLSITSKGREKTLEQIEKTASAHRGMKRRPETCDRIGEATGRSVTCGNGLVFRSALFAQDWLRANGKPKASHSPILKCAKGISYKSAYGFTWKFTVDTTPDIA